MHQGMLSVLTQLFGLRSLGKLFKLVLSSLSDALVVLCQLRRCLGSEADDLGFLALWPPEAILSR